MFSPFSSCSPYFGRHLGAALLPVVHLDHQLDVEGPDESLAPPAFEDRLASLSKTILSASENGILLCGLGGQKLYNGENAAF